MSQETKKIVALIEAVYELALIDSGANECGSDMQKDCADSMCSYKEACIRSKKN